jgi:hypothetical protein
MNLFVKNEKKNTSSFIQYIQSLRSHSSAYVRTHIRTELLKVTPRIKVTLHPIIFIKMLNEKLKISKLVPQNIEPLVIPYS